MKLLQKIKHKQQLNLLIRNNFLRNCTKLIVPEGPQTNVHNPICSVLCNLQVGKFLCFSNSNTVQVFQHAPHSTSWGACVLHCPSCSLCAAHSATCNLFSMRAAQSKLFSVCGTLCKLFIVRRTVQVVQRALHSASWGEVLRLLLRDQH